MSINFLHLDTYGQNFNSDSSKSTFSYDYTNKSLSPNAYNCNFILNYPLQNYLKWYLKGFQTEILFPNIRANSKCNYLTLVCSTGTKKIVLQDRQYIDINTLITDLNSAATTQYPTDFFIFSLSTLSNIGNVMISSSVNSSITVAYSNLSWVLGFSPLTDIITSNSVIASYHFNLAYDTYVNLYISNVNAGHTSNSNNVPCSFRIPINAAGGSIQYNSENLAFSQYIAISTPSNIITSLNIQILDRFGYNIHANGANFTMTLALSTV